MVAVANHKVVVSAVELPMLQELPPPQELPWGHDLYGVTGLPVLVAPEWPQEPLDLGDGWLGSSMDGIAVAYNPDQIKAGLDRALLESSWSETYQGGGRGTMSVGLFQQSRWQL